ncbi:hypothetical protein AX14_011437 [Amanita brunnescens Koide BX004]|nr:hypothetical protein AX14_011437 [Amanita brunnescens Koide BX004]
MTVTSVASLTTAQAHFLALFFASTYVGSLYISKRTRLAFSAKPLVANGRHREKECHERWRDDGDVIRARLVACTLSTTLCILTVVLVHWRTLRKEGFLDAMEATAPRLGLAMYPIRLALTPHMITPLLFSGPLYAMYLDGTLPFMSNWSYDSDVSYKFFSWQGIRNYIMAPITEELVFRASVLAVYDLAGTSRTKMIFFTPLSFGLAHVHHAWETFNKYGRNSTAAKRAIISSVVQLLYTTLFGTYCAYLFLRTGSIFPPISAHAFCNVMGLPELRHEMSMFPSRRYLILLAYIVGVAGFMNRMEPWTRSAYTIYWS